MRALRLLALGAVVSLGGCRQHDAPVSPVSEFTQQDGAADLRAPDEIVPLSVQTYDGSGEAVHPDALVAPAGWTSRFVYLALTPYPGGKSRFENPSLYAGLDGVHFGGSPGAPMPLAKPKTGYLNDPDLSYDAATRELVLYYRQASATDDLFMIRSRDGATWTTPVAAVTAPQNRAISPAVVRRDAGHWMMWSVNADGGCKGASTKVELRYSMNGNSWTAPRTVAIPLDSGEYVWHIDVQWVASQKEYWALFPVKTAGTCATRAVYLATSPDGLRWKRMPAPVIVAGAIPEFRDVVYRSTFAYDPATDAVTLWYSGARMLGKRIFWRTAVQKRSRVELFRELAIAVADQPWVGSAAISAVFDPP